MGKCMKCGCIAYVWNPISTVASKFNKDNKLKEVSVGFILKHCDAVGMNPQQTICMCGHDLTMHNINH